MLKKFKSPIIPARGPFHSNAREFRDSGSRGGRRNRKAGGGVGWRSGRTAGSPGVVRPADDSGLPRKVNCFRGNGRRSRSRLPERTVKSRKTPLFGALGIRDTRLSPHFGEPQRGGCQMTTANAYRLREWRRRRRANRLQICASCSAIFVPGRSDQAFCCPACAQRAYRRRKVSGEPAPGKPSLSEDERDQIGVLRAAGRSMGAIARALGRAKATISRELQRNALPLDGYSPLHAAGAYQLRRRRKAMLEREAALRLFVGDRLAEGWTPEQISAIGSF